MSRQGSEGSSQRAQEGDAVPTLPLIDLMILVAWTSLIVAVVQKAVSMALATRATLFGMTPYDFVLVAGVSLLFALALAARVWVKANEHRLMRGQRETGPLGEVLPDFPDPRRREAQPAEESRAAGGARDRSATG
jgi:membrane protein implicated in regulation of membrane protease activity